MHPIEHLQAKIAASLSNLPIYREPAGLYEPITYTMQQGGKRIRPLLTLIATKMFGGDPDKALPAATAIEIFHNFTLLHDDIIDQAPLRRGLDTVYKKWNINTAILSGDTMFAVAYGQLAGSDPQQLPQLMQVFTKTAIEVCEGQQYDIDFENSGDVTIDAYLNMIRLKTAVLLAASLKIGALIGGASHQDAEAIYRFGENMGIAFQLQDDLLDAYGDEAVFGKKTGGDIIANKKTYLYLKALECSLPENASALRNWFSTRDGETHAKVTAVLDLFDKAGVKQHAENMIQEYIQEAMSHLDAIMLDEKARAPLLELLSGMLKRNH